MIWQTAASLSPYQSKVQSEDMSPTYAILHCSARPLLPQTDLALNVQQCTKYVYFGSLEDK